MRTAVASVVVAVALLFCASRSTQLPPTVHAVTIHNTSAYPFTIDVTGRANDGWMDVTIVGPKSTETSTDVVDQGAEWIFRFRSQGVTGGELRITRSALQANGWRVDVPSNVVATLRDRGVPVSP